MERKTGTRSTEQSITFGSISTSAKTCAAFADVSRVLNVQTGPLAEDDAGRELLGAVARAVEAATLHGTGTNNQLLGVAGYPGVDTRSGATYSVAIAAAQMKAVEAANADTEALSWIMAPDVAETLRQRPKVSGGERMIFEDGKIFNRPAFVSNSVSAGYIFLGQWGGTRHRRAESRTNADFIYAKQKRIRRTRRLLGWRQPGPSPRRVQHRHLGELK